MYRRARTHSDTTLTAHPLDAVGRSPDTPMQATLHRILTPVIAETPRHAGRADIVRELIDGVVVQPQDDRNPAAFDPGRFERAERPARTPRGAYALRRPDRRADPDTGTP
jgi:hypothetical protein